MSDDSLAGEGDSCRSAGRSSGGVGVGDEVGAVSGEFGAERGAVEAGEPESVGGNGGVGAADHLEFEVGDDGGERDGRMREEGGVAEAANLLRAEEGEDDGAARARTGGEGVGEREHGGSAGGVVVGAVVDGVAGGVGGADAEVVEVRGEQDDLVWRGSVPRRMAMAFQVSVRGVFSNWERRCWSVRRQGRGQGDLLQVGAVVAAGREAEGLELRSGEERGDVLVASGGAAAVEFIVGEEGHVGANFAVEVAIVLFARRESNE